ncbi:MAG: hypothetical protein VB861_09920, partial [Planctomycetaceae bacterium]
MKRLSWLILLVVPSLLWAQDDPEPAGDADVAPAAAVSDSGDGATGPTEAADGPGDDPDDGGRAGDGEDVNLWWVEAIFPLCCCGFWGMIPVIILIIFLRRRANAKKRTETLS